MIPEIKNILYATDLSENARLAFGYAVSLANRCGAKITVLHVVEELSSFAKSMVGDIVGQNRWDEFRRRKETQIIASLKSRLEEFCNDMRRDLPECPFVIDQILVKSGHPVDQIVHQAEEKPFDLVIMGSRGQGMLAEVTLGTTSRRVLRRCRRPVLIIRLPD